MRGLSIVIAARADDGDELRCLAALERQVDGAQVLVVRDRDTGPPVPSWVEVATRPDGLVPELWATGLELAEGDVVALTATSMVPGPDWVRSTMELHARGHVAVGGPIEPGGALRPTDWAVYFCRYAPFMLPLGEDVREMAADNASYRREVLARHHDVYGDAFLEPFVHEALRREGHSVDVVPDRVVRMGRGHRVAVFARQRFRHGRRHGYARSAGRSRPEVILAALSAPIVPPLLTFRTARLVFAKQRHRARFIATVPLVALCYSAWAAGELVGRLDAARTARRS